MCSCGVCNIYIIYISNKVTASSGSLFIFPSSNYYYTVCLAIILLSAKFSFCFYGFDFCCASIYTVDLTFCCQCHRITSNICREAQRNCIEKKVRKKKFETVHSGVKAEYTVK